MNIKEIATLADVSVSTVSKIINNKDESISDSTRKKVLKIIDEYQYSPYSNICVSSRSNLIGLLISSYDEAVCKILDGIQNTAFEKGYTTITANISSDAEKQVRILESKKIMGVIVTAATPQIEKAVQSLKQQKIPIIMLNNEDFSEVPSVFCKKKGAGYLATKFLLKKGHRFIGYLGCQTPDEAERKVQEGYTEALYENGILCNSSFSFIGNSNMQAGQAGTQALINTNVTAILCQNSETACYCYQTLREKGIDIPKDMSVISAEDSKLAELLKPQLSAVEQPYFELGKAATKMLIHMIEDKRGPQKKQLELQPVLNHRKSIAHPLSNKRGQGKKIVVVGSINMDIAVNVPHIPRDGETILATGTTFLPGGKGANQAVGVSKLDGLVYLIGRLGDDADGKEIYGSLVNNAVKTEGIIFDNACQTGKAYINVAQDAGSTIVEYPGANHNLDRSQIDMYRHIFNGAEYCLLSLEIPSATAEYAITLCNEKNVKVILKPVRSFNLNILNQIDFIVPNEKELNFLISGDGSVEEKAEQLYTGGANNVIVTLGHNGCYLKNKEYATFFPAADFIPLDTTGAADAFISALAVFLSEGMKIPNAIWYATYSAGLSVTRLGVQSALPDRMALNVYEDDINAKIDDFFREKPV